MVGVVASVRSAGSMYTPPTQNFFFLMCELCQRSADGREGGPTMFFVTHPVHKVVAGATNPLSPVPVITGSPWVQVIPADNLREFVGVAAATVAGLLIVSAAL